MAKWYVITDDEHRACTEPSPSNAGYLGEEVSNPELFDEMFREDTREFRVEDGRLVFDPTPEQEQLWQEMQQDPMADYDAALCELYEMIIREE